LILPLSNCDPCDFRPALQAASAVLTGRRVFPAGAWDEAALWLAGPDALTRAVRPPSRQPLYAEDGGYYTLRNGTGFTFVRCARFRHRPGHADQLHVDLWWSGENVALDAGSFGYNADVPWAKKFEDTASHNTVTVDGQSQTKRVSRFLSYPWPEGSVKSAPDAGLTKPVAYWEGEHSAYARLPLPVSHRRAVVALGDDAWLVIDRLSSPGPHDYRVHWLLADAPYSWDSAEGILELSLQPGDYQVQLGCSSPDATTTLVRADEDGARGWRAPSYGHRVPALSMALNVRAANMWAWTIFSAKRCVVTREGQGLGIRGEDWHAEATVRLEAPGPLATVVIAAPPAAPFDTDSGVA
jgi:hypothetical protein